MSVYDLLFGVRGSAPLRVGAIRGGSHFRPFLFLQCKHRISGGTDASKWRIGWSNSDLGGELLLRLLHLVQVVIKTILGD